ncbi:Ig-like domain repeat protein [Nocardioides marmoriginsengisoli]|uniref:Ig-like domain repeat protein n=1 Tax=Nocardioides marmoriginsengisoli TaxID=661483 RepID=A0A3N0CP37_9ACTN|nr:Ig-like domain repeat protein [Nocardioides marmoriginsengisoli]
MQAPGDDVPAWNIGWNWNWDTSFRYQATGTDVTINESVTYTVASRETFQGQDAYKLNINGSITSGSGQVAVDGVGNATLSGFSGTVSGTRYVRVSDLALLQENQFQHMNATAKVSIISTGITADINLQLTPRDSTWKVHNFPLNAGDSWNTNTNVDYNGGFSYDAGSLGGTGNSAFGPDTMVFNAPSNVTSETLTTAPISGNVNTKKVTSVNADNTMSDQSWWSPTYKNQVKEILVLPLDGGSITLTRNMRNASIPSGPQFSATTTPSLTCAGGDVTVAGNLSTGAAGVPVTVRLDQSQVTAGQYVTANTTTGANGAYSVNLTTPGISDGLGKNGSRANWGITVAGAGATGASTVVVTPTNCSTIAYTGATSAPVSGAATVSAQLTDLANPAGAAGKTVTFALGGGGSVNAVTNGSGVATATLPMNGPVRNTNVSVSYAGSAGLAAASASTGFAVQVNPTSTTVLPSLTTVTIGDDVTFSSTVTPSVGSNPGGAVQFLVDGAAFGAPRPVTGGTATSAALNTGPLSLGDHTVQAVYNGDANFGTSSSATATFRVRVPLLPSSTSLSIAPNSTVYGEQVTLSSHVTTTSGSGNPTGSVTFSEGGTVFGSAPVDGSGNASIDTSTIPVGTHAIVATYSGDDEYNGGASSPGTLTVAKADVDVQLTSSDTTTVSGESVNFGVSVGAQAPGSGLPDGTVQLVIDGGNVGSPVALTGGVANFDPVSSLLVGNHTVAVNYSGSGNFKSGSDSLSQVVSQADTTTVVTVSPSPSSEDQLVTITANVGAVAPGGGAATGLVTFTADGDPIGAGSLSPSSGGAKATLQTSTLAAGSHTIVATYEGDTDYAASESDPKSHTVIAGAAVVGTSTVVTSSQNPSTYGEFISFTATVTAEDSSAASGAVQFSIDGTDIGIPVEVGPDGTAQSPLVSSPEPGDHTVIAAFVGNPGYSGSGDFLAQTVADAGVDLTVTSSNASSAYGDAVTFTATATTPQENIGDPNGHVQFRVDGVAVGGAVALNDGVATSPAVSNLTPGSHVVTADYSGSAHFAPALASTTQDVGKVSTTTTLVAAPSSVSFGQGVSLTATVTPGTAALGAPSGTVTFTEGSTTLGTAVVGASGTNGKATLAVSNLSGGTHLIKATYSGSAVFSGSASAASTVTVAKIATSITAQPALVKLLPPLALPLGQLKITLNSANGPVAGVPVNFTIGTATVCAGATTDAYGVATCNALPQLLTLTLFGYKVSFAGNGDYLPSNATGFIIK